MKPKKKQSGVHVSLATLLMVWEGSEIPRLPDDRINLSAMVRASNAFTGEGKRLRDWRRLATTRDYVVELAQAKEVAVESLMGPLPVEEKARGTSLVSGSRENDVWGDPDVATELAGWLHTRLRVDLNRWVRGELTRRHRRPRPLTAADAKAVLARKDSNAQLNAEIDRRGLKHHIINRQYAFLLTGHVPKHWEEALGPGWQDRTSIEWQKRRREITALALPMVKKLPEDASSTADGSRRDPVAVGIGTLTGWASPSGREFRGHTEVHAVLAVAVNVILEGLGLERMEPKLDGPAFIAARLRRIAAMAGA